MKFCSLFGLFLLVTAASVEATEEGFYCVPAESSNEVVPTETCNCTAMQEDITKLQSSQRGYIDNFAFSFPRLSTGDYVKYHPRFPQMGELTLCFWINSSDLTTTRSIFSYSYSSTYDAFLIQLMNPTTLYVTIANAVHKLTVDLKENQNNHLCVWFSHPLNRVGVHLNGALRDDTPYVGSWAHVVGGGVLILGQDQDSSGGGFHTADMFLGTITNVKIWPRVLSSTEIKKIANRCTYPLDVIVDLSLQKVEWFGEVAISYPDTCPTV